MTSATSQEIGDRLRRIETRLTSYMVRQGFDAGGAKPEWLAGEVMIPSRYCSVKDIVDAIPEDWAEDVKVTLEGEFVMWVATRDGTCHCSRCEGDSA